LQISIIGVIALHPCHIALAPSHVSMPVQVPYMFMFVQTRVIPSRFWLHGQDAPPAGTHHLLGAEAAMPPVPPPPIPPPPTPASPAPPSALSYVVMSRHVKPLGHIPSTVQSIAQNASPGGAVRHASDGSLQSEALEHLSHACPRSGTQMGLPAMIEQ
jgi:hypothetical protein